MASILDSVNLRTQLVGQNRLELLLFGLSGEQKYGINVFKVREVLMCPELTDLPNPHAYVVGLARIRGQNIIIIDLNRAVGKQPIEDLSKAYVIISEYNGSVQGFLVSSVERIVNVNWDKIEPPPTGSGKDGFLTAITNIDEKIIEIIDVESILNELNPIKSDLSHEMNEQLKQSTASGNASQVMVVDDSAVARKQVTRALAATGLEMLVATNGLEALTMIKSMLQTNPNLTDKMPLIISDIEMPKMDGYTLTAELRALPQLKNLKIMLHTSLSGGFNEAMVKKVGADAFISKFDPNLLAQNVSEYLNAHKPTQAVSNI